MRSDARVEEAARADQSRKKDEGDDRLENRLITPHLQKFLHGVRRHERDPQAIAMANQSACFH
jgi:hypothetical protein